MIVQQWRGSVAVATYGGPVEDGHGFGHAFLMAHDSASINADPHSADARGPIGQAVTHVLDLLLPPQCLNCGCIVETTGALCAPCWEQVSFLTSPFCACCGLPFEEDAGTDALCGRATVRALPINERVR
jgi:hypothetical protein